MLSPKQILQTLPLALRQIKTGNNSEGLLDQASCLIFVSIKRNYQKCV